MDLQNLAWTDTTGDGIGNIGLGDTNLDGRYDIAALDQNGDGYVEAYAWDTNGDGAFDTISQDTNLDGVLDSNGWDTDHNGLVDHVAGPATGGVATRVPEPQAHGGGGGSMIIGAPTNPNPLIEASAFADPYSRGMIDQILDSQSRMIDVWTLPGARYVYGYR
jgi:hypothetical protein